MKNIQDSIDIDTYFNQVLPGFIKKTAQGIPALLRKKQKKSAKEYV